MSLSLALRRTMFRLPSTVARVSRTRQMSCLMSSRGISTSRTLFNKETPAAENAEETPKEETPTEETPAADAPAEDSFEAQLEKAQVEIKELKEKLMYQMAETQNVRNRSKKEVENAANFGINKFATSMLEVADTLTMATDSAKKEMGDGEIDPKLKTLMEGVDMTNTVLAKALERSGVTKFESLGLKFDPNFHDGLFQMEDPSREPGTVGAVMKEGYMLKERVLRPANVGTVKAPAK